MIKAAGFLFVTLSGWGLGCCLLARDQQKGQAILQGIRMLRFLYDEIHFRSTPVEEILLTMNRMNLAPAFLRDNTAEPCTINVPSCFSAEERERWNECFAQLGHLYSTQEEQLILSTIAWAQQLLKQQEEKCRRGERLYRQVGVCAGLALAILML